MSSDPLSPDTWFILAHCFNMDGRAASQTITDRIPFLSRKGIQPVVLSAPTGRKDTAFPHYRILSLAPSGLLFEGRQIINKHLTSPTGKHIGKAILTLFLLPLYLLEKIFIHLDSQWSWFMGATGYGLILIRRHQPLVIYSTAGPPSTHLAGYLLHCLTGLPWLAELHDPLVQNHERPHGQTYHFKRWLEKCILTHASGVIYFSEQAMANAQQRVPIHGIPLVLRPGAHPPETSTYIYHKRETIHFAHFGSLGGDRTLAPVIKALHALLDATPAWRNIVRLDVYGAELDPVARQSLTNCPLPATLVEHGRLEYDQGTGKSGRERVIEAMRQSDVLLLLHGAGPACSEYIPSKMYEYLITGRPILALAAKGSELEAMLQCTGHAAVSTEDQAGIHRLLTDFIVRWQTQGLPGSQAPSPYTIEAAVHSIIALVQQITPPSIERAQ